MRRGSVRPPCASSAEPDPVSPVRPRHRARPVAAQRPTGSADIRGGRTGPAGQLSRVGAASSGRCRWRPRCVRCSPAAACAAAARVVGAGRAWPAAGRRRCCSRCWPRHRRPARGARWWACPGSAWSPRPRREWRWTGSRSCPARVRTGSAWWRALLDGVDIVVIATPGRGAGTAGGPARGPGPATGGGARARWVRGPVPTSPSRWSAAPGTASARGGAGCAAGRSRWSHTAGAPPTRARRAHLWLPGPSASPPPMATHRRRPPRPPPPCDAEPRRRDRRWSLVGGAGGTARELIQSRR